MRQSVPLVSYITYGRESKRKEIKGKRHYISKSKSHSGLPQDQECVICMMSSRFRFMISLICINFFFIACIKISHAATFGHRTSTPLQVVPEKQ